MRRSSLSTKLLAAALPLVVAVAALLGLTVRNDLSNVHSAENGADLGAVWTPLISALGALDTESAEVSNGATATTATRLATDEAINALRVQIEPLGAFDAASHHITAGESALSAARRDPDVTAVPRDLADQVDPLEAYAITSRELVAVGQLLPSEAGDPGLGRELLAVVKLAEAKLSANTTIAAATAWQANPTDITPLATARNAYIEMEATLGEFEAIAPEEWTTQYRQSGFPAQLAKYRSDLDQAMRSATLGEPASFDTESFAGLVSNGVQFQSTISESIVERASLEASSARQTTLIRIAIILGAVLLAGIIALLIIRSITRRIAAVSASAKQVAAEQLPALVEALRDPRGKAVLPAVQRVDAKGNDELAELANSFNSMQDTLVDVAQEQVEVLRRGVSEIFVTMARRNRSLIDRQLAMLDEFEAEVDDSTVLGNYYQLDHLATRMRRNSESLLVLADAEPKRRRVKATEIDDVVRASLGEVEDYRRIDIEHLESLQVRGTVVADVAHLIAELLDNATAFSPPESPVRVGGRRAGDSYLLRIVDEGIGIPTERLRYLNDLLRDPPVAGLSVESTLGISVVSMIANKHGIAVTLSAGNPGLSVDISLPSTLFGPIEQPPAQPIEVSAPTIESDPVEEGSIVAWNTADSAFLTQANIDGEYEQVAEFEGAELRTSVPDVSDSWIDEPQPVDQAQLVEAVETWDDQPVVAPDWTKMALDLTAFRSGQLAASDDAPVEPDLHQAPEPAVDPDPETAMQMALAAFDEPAEPAVDANSELAMQEEIAAFEEPDQSDVPTPTLSNLPPPPLAARAHGEFDAPLAPPLTAAGPSRGPVAPVSARSAPARLPADPPQPSLPVRTVGATADGLDPLAEIAFSQATPNDSRDYDVQDSAPPAFQAALSVSGSDEHGPLSLLPTRTRHDDVPIPEEPALSTSSSRPDPEALRERLRAFQNEFSGGAAPEPLDDRRDVGGEDR